MLLSAAITILRYVQRVHSLTFRMHSSATYLTTTTQSCIVCQNPLYKIAAFSNLLDIMDTQLFQVLFHLNYIFSQLSIWFIIHFKAIISYLGHWSIISVSHTAIFAIINLNLMEEGGGGGFLKRLSWSFFFLIFCSTSVEITVIWSFPIQDNILLVPKCLVTVDGVGGCSSNNSRQVI